jgi:A/G-specific adenine glycosylase
MSSPKISPSSLNGFVSLNEGAAGAGIKPPKAARTEAPPQAARIRPPVAEALVAWYHQGHRDLPWRRTKDPYAIWVSEIMLQQTRAQAVIPYYERFLACFPSARALAAATLEDVLVLWSGLGYYSRARNLWRAAAQIEAAGGFPREYDAIRALPGVGGYTAAAIASIAFDLPHAAVDGNVLRVVSRVENDSSDIGSSITRDRFRQVVERWLDPTKAGAFNQALMELGATLCLPRDPLCLLCPVAGLCRAREHGTARQLPVKLRRVEPQRLEGTLLLIRRRGRVLLRQTEPHARRLAGFWELPTPVHLPEARMGAPIGRFRHTITHHHYLFTVVPASGRLAIGPDGAFRWFPPAEIVRIPLSTTARKALRIAGVL